MARKTVTVDSEIVNLWDTWAKAKGVSKEEAYDRFGRMGIHRNNALAKHEKNKKAGKGAKAGKGKKAAKKEAAGK